MFDRCKHYVRRIVADENGATAIEYGLIAAAMGLMLVAAMPTFRAALQDLYGAVASAVQTANNS